MRWAMMRLFACVIGLSLARRLEGDGDDIDTDLPHKLLCKGQTLLALLACPGPCDGAGSGFRIKELYYVRYLYHSTCDDAALERISTFFLLSLFCKTLMVTKPVSSPSSH